MVLHHEFRGWSQNWRPANCLKTARNKTCWNWIAKHDLQRFTNWNAEELLVRAGPSADYDQLPVPMRSTLLANDVHSSKPLRAMFYRTMLEVYPQIESRSFYKTILTVGTDKDELRI